MTQIGLRVSQPAQLPAGLVGSLFVNSNSNQLQPISNYGWATPAQAHETLMGRRNIRVICGFLQLRSVLVGRRRRGRR